MPFQLASRDAMRMINGLRLNLDRVSRFKNVVNSRIGEGIISASVVLEESRLRLRNTIYRRFKEPIDEQKFIADELVACLVKLENILSEIPEIRDIPFREFYHEARDSAYYGDIFRGQMPEKFGPAVSLIRTKISEERKNLDRQLELLPAEYVKLVPEQKIAPASFEIIDGVLSVVNDKGDGAPAVENDRSAREHVLELGDRIVEKLSRTNCDPRLSEEINRVKNLVLEDRNPIKIGLSGLSASAVYNACASELPDVLSGLVASFCASVSMYVSQNSDWKSFVNNSVDVHFDADSISKILEAAKAFAQEARRSSDVADPSVPFVIEQLQIIIDRPKVNSKRIAFAIFRTIENACAAIYKYFFNMISQSALRFSDVVVDKLPGQLYKLVTIGAIAGLALQIPAIEAVSPWIAQATKVVVETIRR